MEQGPRGVEQVWNTSKQVHLTESSVITDNGVGEGEAHNFGKTRSPNRWRYLQTALSVP